ncbi:MAG: ferritin family protein [Thermodesulfovibrionales bacterium]
MEHYSIREVVEQAVRAERLGYDYYSSMSLRHAKDRGLSDLFGKLAAKELEHEKKFQDLEKGWHDEEPEGWEEVSEYLRVIVESEFFLGSNKALRSLEQVTTVEAAVKFAVGFEKETLLYYYAVRKMLKDKSIIDVIIEEEKSHIIQLGKFAQGLAEL